MAAAGTDTLFYNGAAGTDIPARGGLAPDTDITDDRGSVRNIERQASIFVSSTRLAWAAGCAGGGAPASGA